MNLSTWHHVDTCHGKMTDRLINWHHERQTHRRKWYLTWQSNYFHHPSYRSPQAETWFPDQKIGRTITTDRSIFFSLVTLWGISSILPVGKPWERNVFYDQHVARMSISRTRESFNNICNQDVLGGRFFLKICSLCNPCGWYRKLFILCWIFT